MELAHSPARSRSMGVADAANRRNAAARSARAVRRDHPATAAQKIYDEDESAFLRAVDAFHVRTGIRFPTAVELLRCAEEAGYVRLPAGTRMVEMGPAEVARLAETLFLEEFARDTQAAPKTLDNGPDWSWVHANGRVTIKGRSRPAPGR